MPVKTTDDFVKAPVGTAAVQACACCKMDMPVVLLKSRGARPDNVRYDGPSRVAIEGQYCEFCEFVALYKSSEKYNGRVAAGKIVRGEGRELVAFVPFLEDEDIKEITVGDEQVPRAHGLVLLAEPTDDGKMRLVEVLERGVPCDDCWDEARG